MNATFIYKFSIIDNVYIFFLIQDIILIDYKKLNIKIKHYSF